MRHNGPVQWLDFEILTDTGLETVRGRREGPFLAVHRVDPQLDSEVTSFGVTHLPTKLSLGHFSSEKFALNLCKALVNDLGKLVETMQNSDDPRVLRWRARLPIWLRADEARLFPVDDDWLAFDDPQGSES